MTVTPAPLAEYESCEVALGQDAARELDEIAAGRLTVALGSRPGQWRITARQHVGVIVTPAIRLVIRPKIGLDNLFAMLGVGLPAQAWQAKTFAFDITADLLAALSGFYARSLQQATVTGLVRAYRSESDRLVALRGRVDLPGQLRHPGVPSPIACRFDEYTPDIVENRFLKAATRHLLRVPGVPVGTRGVLKHALGSFEGVGDELPRPDVVDRIVFTRLNRHYEPALRLAQLVLRNLSLVDRAGATDASAFLVDMNDLFQRYVTDRLRRALRGRLTVVSEPIVHLGEGHQVPMRPDLRFDRHDQTVFVADVKYKLTGTGLGFSGDYYQLLAYTTAMRLPAGLLIYAQVSGNAPPQEVIPRHTGTRLLTSALDLTGSPAEVEQALEDLAGRIVQLAQPAAERPGRVGHPGRVRGRP